jgi:D-alanyl-D-alanine carboxypeptidase/D-alanyl-D-alanine-endopeptidase (penicillin-binding protein 4)
VVVDADGRQLAFAVVAAHVSPTGTLGAEAALDRIATALAGCGCR